MNGTSPNRIRRNVRIAAMGLMITLTTACAAMPATLTAALVAFCQDLLITAARNFAPNYAESASGVLLALAETATGQPFTILPEGGIAQASSAPGDYGAYDDQSAGYPAADSGYGTGGYAEDYPVSRSVPAERIEFEVAIFAQRREAGGAVSLQPVADGDVLRRGESGPDSGDKVKFFFRTNCECFVYIINVDATAWITQVFPPRGAPQAPVTEGSENLVPEGTRWWGLDEYTGVETIYFVASRERLDKLEANLAELPEQRPALDAGFRSVAEAGLLPSRGLVPVEDVAPTTVASDQGQTQPIMPLAFTTQGNETQMVVTRWFRHE